MILTEETNYPSSAIFIEEWLNNFNVFYDTDAIIPNTNFSLDYLISETGIGIMIVNWRKPISVKIINKAVHAIDNLRLQKIFIVCKDISDYVVQTLSKIKYDIEIIHPFGLSSIAIMIANLSKQNYIELISQK